MIGAGRYADDRAALGRGLSLLGRRLAADRAAVYQVDGSKADGSPRLALVVSKPGLIDDVPTPVPAPGFTGEIRYLPDMGRADLPAIRTYFAVPVVAGGQLIGLVELVATRVDAFPEPDRRDALVLVTVLGRVLDNARRQEEKSAVLALAAHELRTPLASAAGYAQTIAQQLDRLEPGVVRDLLGRILHNHRRLERLVDDLVDLSSIDGCQLQVSPQPVAAAPLLEEIVCSADDGAHPLSWQVADGLPMLWADRNRLEQVVTNLVTNAAKFSPEGSPISIRADRRGDVVVIEVADRGPGIPPDQVDRIFEAYYQGDMLSGGRPQGLGIGLYLTRVLCELMGGSVSVESHSGRGSRFIVTLPAVPSPAPAGEA